MLSWGRVQCLIEVGRLAGIAPQPNAMVEANPVVQTATSTGASRITGIKREAPRAHIVGKNPLSPAAGMTIGERNK